MIPQTINDPGKSEAEGQSNWYHSLFRTISSMTNLVIIILIGIILYFLLLIEQGYLISVLQVFIILLAPPSIDHIQLFSAQAKYSF